MDFSDEWKSLWPISSVHSPPLFIPNPGENLAGGKSHIGPLIFNPVPETLTQLLKSPSLAPQLPPPYPSLSLPRFLQTSSNTQVLPSTCTAISSEFGTEISSDADLFLGHNRLQLLRCPGTDYVLGFFPNSDRVGFVVLSVEDSELKVKGDVFTSGEGLNGRIVQILVNPVGDSGIVGYLLVCTMYSVHWFCAKIKEVGLKKNAGLIRPMLGFLGSKFFKSCSVVHACWSPHLPEESLVLLESGELFLFDLDSCSSQSRKSLPGRKLKVLWDQCVLSENVRWVSCAFSWHPRILIVAHSSAVFLVDLRSEGSKVSCLLNIDMININHVENDQFVALSVVDHDRFYFVAAATQLVVLCDLRKPLMPVLRWAHSISSPSYISVLRLSELRPQAKDVEYHFASENGYGIIVGSFWNCEFSLFCYGPDVRETSVASDVSGYNKSIYAWGLPSNLPLAALDCECGTCLLKEGFSKDELPEWIDWRQKKEIVLGFGIIDKDLSAQLKYQQDSFEGFVLVRLTSSGKLESQRYCPSWEYAKTFHSSHSEHHLNVEDSLLYENDEEEYKFRKTYHYLELDWLRAYLKSTLGKTLLSELVTTKSPEKKSSSGWDFHENICQKLKACKFKTRSSRQVHDSFLDINLPTSIHEIALSDIWGDLPINILRLGFSTYPELLEVLVKHKKVPLEFLEVPSQPQLPPFSFRKPSSRRNKWSSKHQPGDALVGPVVPLPCLVAFRNIHKGNADTSSADSEINIQCHNVMRVANEVAMPGFGSQDRSEDIVSLAEDKDMLHSSQNTKKMFSSYKPAAFSSESLDKNSIHEDERHTTVIFRVCQKDGPEVFDSQCPLKFKFDDRDTNFGSNESKMYKLLKRQFSNFKEGFTTYKDYLAQSNIQV